MFRFFRAASPRPPIRFFNTLTRAKEDFAPLKPRQLTMYSCGPTVYDHIHIGNLRAYLLPDLIVRLFLYNGFKVNTTVNLTDFGHLSDDADAGEDKMMKGMKREGYEITLPNMRAFAEPYIESFQADCLAFGNRPPTQYARASDYVTAQIKLIQTLEEKGYAYRTSDGVYFDIAKFPAYGRLGNVDLNELRAGARVEVNEEKHHPADFALWKKGELGWDSRWGKGFPGWHIECTAMAFATLGKQIDIHTGGEDLQYTHHNGETAQAEAVTGKRYVGYWLHNAHIAIDNMKISKSLGNGLRLRHLADRGFSPLDYRYWLLQTHYRAPANFTWEAMAAARTALWRLRRLAYEELRDIRPGYIDTTYETRFAAALSDDLDTPKALSIFWELAKDKAIAPKDKLATIHFFDSLLSLGLSKDPAVGRAELGMVEEDAPGEVKELMARREAARQERDFARSDQLREEIRAHGFEVQDTPEGPRLSRLPSPAPEI